MQQEHISSMEEMNNHHHYHQLPGNNNEEIEGPSSQKHNQNKVHLNKYAFAGAILASTNSILLGYGKLFHSFIH